jgi:hypothetical protein
MLRFEFNFENKFLSFIRKYFCKIYCDNNLCYGLSLILKINFKFYS